MGMRAKALWILLVLPLWFGMTIAVEAAAPRAQMGVIDLSQWMPATDGVIRLQGEWEFYWQQFIHPDEFAAMGDAKAGAFAQVPGKWQDGKYGYATYRLRLLHADNLGPLALYIPYEQSAYRLWIDGELKAGNGEVGPDRQSSTPEYRPVIIPFEAWPGNEEIELVIHVSNFDFRLGGLWNSPLFGPKERLEHVIDVRNMSTALLGGGFLVVAIYHFAFSLFRRSTNATRAALALAFLSLSIATRTLLMGHRAVTLLWPDLPWALQIQLEYLTGYTAVLSMAVYLASTFPRETPKVILWAATLSALIGGTITVLTPVRYSSLITPYVIVIDALFVLCFIAIGTVAYLRRREGGNLLLTGGLIFGTTAFLDFLYYNRVIEFINLMPFGFLGLVVCQSLILGQQFASAFNMQAKLLHDLQNSRSLIAQLHERERREVAEFLHGRVQSRLLILRERLKEAMRLIGQQDVRASKSVQAVYDELLEVQQEDIRRASHLLHPAAIEVGLIPAVRGLGSSYDGTLNVSIKADQAVTNLDELSAFGFVDHGNPILSRSLRICLYRIVEECLGNAQKHSGGSRIEIDFQRVGESLQLTITDDGVGIPEDSTPSHGLGLKIVEARVREANGTWHIAARPEGGTAIQVTVPLEPAEFSRPVNQPATG